VAHGIAPAVGAIFSLSGAIFLGLEQFTLEQFSLTLEFCPVFIGRKSQRLVMTLDEESRISIGRKSQRSVMTFYSNRNAVKNYF
jgi:hypothetical protein